MPVINHNVLFSRLLYELIPFAESGEQMVQGHQESGGGPPGDRTRDTVIKSHVLYH